MTREHAEPRQPEQMYNESPLRMSNVSTVRTHTQPPTHTTCWVLRSARYCRWVEPGRRSTSEISKAQKTSPAGGLPPASAASDWR